MKNRTRITRLDVLCLNKILFFIRGIPAIIIYCISVIGLGVCSFILNQNIIGIILIVLGFALPFLVLYYYNKKSSDEYKKNKKIYENLSYDFYFLDNSIKIVINSINGNYDKYIDYNKFSLVYEIKTHIAFFLDDGNTFILNKGGFDNQEDLIETRKLVKSKVRKYKEKNI